jgi:Shikimate dehydrogenase substrate binding domain
MSDQQLLPGYRSSSCSRAVTRLPCSNSAGLSAPADLATAESRSFRVAGRSYPQTDEQPRDCVQRGSTSWSDRSPRTRCCVCRWRAGPATSGRGSTTSLRRAGPGLVYKAYTTTDLAAAIAGIRALGIRGCGVSMPYKEACIEFVDAMDASAEAIGSVNTIVNTDGQLRAYNTTPTTSPSPSSWPTTRCRWTTPSPCSAPGHGQGRGRSAP